MAATAETLAAKMVAALKAVTAAMTAANHHRPRREGFEQLYGDCVSAACQFWRQDGRALLKPQRWKVVICERDINAEHPLVDKLGVLLLYAHATRDQQLATSGRAA